MYRDDVQLINDKNVLVLDEFLGWMFDLLFPFAAVGLMDVT